MVDKFIHLRSHYLFGRHKISMYPTRYHEARSDRRVYGSSRTRDEPVAVPSSGQDLNKRWHRYESPSPNVGSGWCEVHPNRCLGRARSTAIDDCTRPRVLRIYDRCNRATAIRLIDYLLVRSPFEIHSIQTDNEAEFRSRFHWHVVDRSIEHVYVDRRTPRLNGKVERSHRIDQEEFYRLAVDAVRTFHLAVETRCLRPDADVLDALVGHVPVEPRLGLGVVGGLDGVPLERELGQHVIDELDGGDLLQRSSRSTRSRVQSSMAVNW